MAERDFALPGGSEVTGEPAGECVSGTRRIVDVFQRIRGATEERVVPEKEAAVLALFDGDKALREAFPRSRTACNSPSGAFPPSRQGGIIGRLPPSF